MSMLEELGSIVLDTHSLGGFTDEEFYHFCLDNRNLKFERDSETNIIVISSTGGKIGYYNGEVLAELTIWNRKLKLGVCFDSSMAFKLPNTAVRSPDAAWIRKERWQALTEKEQEQFPPLCPDFVIEIKSPSDSLPSLKIKMQEWMDNGCRLAWLINPETGITVIYHNHEIAVVAFNQNLTGEDVLEGFSITLSTIFE